MRHWVVPLLALTLQASCMPTNLTLPVAASDAPGFSNQALKPNGFRCTTDATFTNMVLAGMAQIRERNSTIAPNLQLLRVDYARSKQNVDPASMDSLSIALLAVDITAKPRNTAYKLVNSPDRWCEWSETVSVITLDPAKRGVFNTFDSTALGQWKVDFPEAVHAYQRDASLPPKVRNMNWLEGQFAIYRLSIFDIGNQPTYSFKNKQRIYVGAYNKQIVRGGTLSDEDGANAQFLINSTSDDQ